jgi:hypothetical protein
MTRDEHLAWAKARAAEHLNAGEAAAAAASLVSDINKHDELRGQFTPLAVIRAGTIAALKGPASVRDWIASFK